MPPSGSLEWSRERIEQTAMRICDHAVIREMLADAVDSEPQTVRDILHKAADLQGLSPAEVATLVQVRDPQLREEISETARQVHGKAYSGRIRLVAPVCPTNRCVNDCSYCPLRRSNAQLRRGAETARIVQREVTALLDQGYRHVDLVFGDDRSGIHYIRDMVWATYGTRSGVRQIQRVDVNFNPPRVSDLQQLKGSGRLGTFHAFQETYDPDTYRALHPDGPKADYAWRLTAHDRAIEAGLTDLGLGFLLGAGELVFDLVATHAHANYLRETYDLGPTAISYPRMVPVPRSPSSAEGALRVSDADFCFTVAITRLADPHIDIVLSTPASRDTRLNLYAMGVSHVSVGSTTYPGVYTDDGDPEAAGGLTIGRPRALEVLVYRMCEAGYVPNFCVACYVPQDRRATVALDGERVPIPDRCAVNSLLALKEYMMDYASSETRLVVERLIHSKLAELPENLRTLTLELMEEAEAGIRDVTV